MHSAKSQLKFYLCERFHTLDLFFWVRLGSPILCSFFVHHFVAARNPLHFLSSSEHTSSAEPGDYCSLRCTVEQCNDDPRSFDGLSEANTC